LWDGADGGTSMTVVYLSLGSNVGNRAANLSAAIAALPGAGVHIVRVSSIYETEPVDYLRQAWFLNCVVEGQTEVAAVDLLRQLRSIEAAMGSTKPIAKGPRVMDVDILLYGDTVIATPELQVPHPRMAERRFVLVPLSELAPELRHPVSGKTALEMLRDTKDRSEVR
jgi:2-amino-4-hydroxy-6-hydroxymethyldihydropteridine diphosphokinase